MDRARIFTSPGFVIAVALLVANDFVLKNLFHNWLTGKLSDVAGLFVFPLFFAAWIPGWRRGIYIGTAVAFVIWKSTYSQPFIDIANSVLPWTIGRTPDATDLLALAVLPVSWLYSNRTHPQRSRPFAVAMSIVSVVAFAATQYVWPEHVIPYHKIYRFSISQDELVRRLEFTQFDLTQEGRAYYLNLKDAICDSSYPRVELTTSPAADGGSAVLVKSIRYNCANRVQGDQKLFLKEFDQVLMAVMRVTMAQPYQRGLPAPRADHHQHLFSAEATRGSRIEPLDAADLIKYLDEAGIRRAAVLSTAYQFSNPNRPPVENEYEKVKAENDWTSRQVERFPDRLRGFCSVNPLKDYAIPELERCASNPYMRRGMKLHFGNSDVDLDNPEHVYRVSQLFRAANKYEINLVIHMRSSVSRQRPFGAKQAQTFLNELVPAAPDVFIQIAHLTGGGSYDEPSTDEALSVFADAVARHDPRMDHVVFDVSGIAGFGKWMEKSDQIVKRIRQLDVRRIVFGSDGARGGGLTPRDAWKNFLQLPLTDEEFRTIAGNVEPYLKP